MSCPFGSMQRYAAQACRHAYLPRDPAIKQCMAWASVDAMVTVHAKECEWSSSLCLVFWHTAGVAETSCKKNSICKACS
eukprot:542870-Amphidinium_carterae.1